MSLRWTQVDRNQNVIWFGDHDLSMADRRKGRGSVPISAGLADLLDRLREGNSSPYVLISKYGCRFRDINWDQWNEVIAAAGLTGLRPHDLRHTAATNLIREGEALINVSKLLGHANTKITEKVYVTHEPQFLTGAVSTLDRLTGVGK